LAGVRHRVRAPQITNKPIVGPKPLRVRMTHEAWRRRAITEISGHGQ
jgi:hypothetical protein